MSQTIAFRDIHPGAVLVIHTKLNATFKLRVQEVHDDGVKPSLHVSILDASVTHRFDMSRPVVMRFKNFRERKFTPGMMVDFQSGSLNSIARDYAALLSQPRADSAGFEVWSVELQS